MTARRAAIVLHADIAGYARLMEGAQTRVLGRLLALRRGVWEPAIAGHGGRIANTAGDAVLVEFAAAGAAVACARALHRGMAGHDAGVPDDRRMRLRIGITAGDVLPDERGDLFGEAVNLAARLGALAEPGGVRVSAAVAAMLPAEGWEDLGDFHVKNIARPVHVLGLRIKETSPTNIQTWTLTATTPSSMLFRHALDVAKLAGPEGLVVGRQSLYCDLAIAHDSVSRRHARLRLGADGAVTVEDLGATNGVRLADRRLPPFAPSRVPTGSTFWLGEVALTLSRS